MKRFGFLWSGMFGVLIVVSLFVEACGGGSGGGSGGGLGTLTVSLSSSTVIAPQNGTPGKLDITVGGANTGSAVSVSASGFPSGVIFQFTPAAGGLSGTFSFAAQRAAPAGTYSANVVV